MDTTEIESITKKLDAYKTAFDNHELSIKDDTGVLSEIKHQYMDSEFISDEESSVEESEQSVQSIPQIKYEETATNNESSTVSKMTSEMDKNNSTSINDIKSNASILISEFSSSLKSNKESTENNSNSSVSSRLFVKNPKHSKKSKKVKNK